MFANHMQVMCLFRLENQSQPGNNPLHWTLPALGGFLLVVDAEEGF